MTSQICIKTYVSIAFNLLPFRKILLEQSGRLYVDGKPHWTIIADKLTSVQLFVREETRRMQEFNSQWLI